MNNAVRAALAVALGVGLAASAQAHGTNLRGAAAPPQQQAATQQQMQQSQATTPRLTRKQAMKMKRSKLALARQHRLHRFATLHRKGTASQTIGVGSSMPNANGSTNATPVTPRANTMPSAGGNNATTNQNTPNKY